MKPLIVANWKCNPQTLIEAKKLFNSLKRRIKNIKNIEVVICPPFVYLSILGVSTSARRKAGFGGLASGSQDCFWEEKGAFTGEISSLMLKDLGCDYVILGHSERRRWFGETDDVINKKMKKAILVKLNPIFCIGETKTEREKGKTQNILKSQIEKGLKKISKKEIKNIVIAYEPVWAIGTGKPCDVKEAQIMGLLIRKIINRIFSRNISEKIRIIYGGSVNSKNAAGYIKEARMDGLLIGGASLNPQEFIKIIKAVKKS
ncbi:triose-phosphate isomerase [Patescibacteria group bacterium]|nr:triose-phosphate isomerase [Patescibacteria group bacterium]